MRVLQQIALVMLVTLWVPATSHCLLTALSGLEALACCTHDDTASAPSHENECDTDACATVESGSYRSEQAEIATPQPCFNLLPFADCELDPSLAGMWSARVVDDTSLQWAPARHFRLRTALPARAPTLPC